MEYIRIIQKQIEANLFKNKVIIIYGARRVGKTTLSKSILQKYDGSRYINCELLQNKMALETTNSDALRAFLGNDKIVVLDEAQYINNIGLILKIINDTFPDLQIIVTGSSSFELGNTIAEPLTGRSRQYLLMPFSIEELLQNYTTVDITARLENILRFGLYPEVFDKPEDYMVEELNNIASNYLYKDVLQFERLKRSDLLMNLLRALALQLGSEVSMNELSKTIGTSVQTIQKYIDLLEKSFVIFSLKSYSRNLRKEIAKSKKIFFYDLGIRNAIIQNFNPLSLRNDVGGLWENFCIVERIKRTQYHRIFSNNYFWRTYDQKEVDYIEEHSGQLHAYEFKYNPKANVKWPKEFLETYDNSSLTIVNSDNFLEKLI